MGRELRRKQAKKEGKSLQRELPAEEHQVKKLIIITLILVVIITVIYLLSALFVTKELDWFENDKEEVELKNKAEGFIAQIDETLNAENANVSEEQKSQVKVVRDELQKAIDNNDYDTLRTKLNELEQAAQAMAQAMYQQQAQSGANTSSNAQDDNVVDADFKPKD